MLTATGFLLLCIFLAAPGFYASAVWSVRAERVFLPALLLNSLLLYVCAVFHWARPGFYLILAANLALYAPVFRQLKKDGCAAVLRRFLTPGTVFALVFMALWFPLTLTRDFLTWDEISHWGFAARLFFDTGRLGCEFGGNMLMHASYPPGTVLTGMLTHFCFFGVPFRENIILFAGELLMLGVWLQAFALTDFKHKFLLFLLACSYFILPVLFMEQMAHTCYTDAPLAALFALTLYLALTARYTPFELFTLGIFAAYLFFIRNAGFGYAVMILTLFSVRAAADRKQVFRDESGRFVPARLAALLWVFLLPFAVKYSWSFLLNHYHTPLRFGGTGISLHGIVHAFLYNNPPRTYRLSAMFCRELLCGYLEFFLALAAGFLFLWKKSVSPERRRACKYAAFFFPAAFLLFLAVTLIYYIFEFCYDFLPSYHRYLCSFLMVPALTLGLFLTGEAVDRTAARPAENLRGLFRSAGRKKYFAVSVALLLISVALTCFALFHREKKYYARIRRETAALKLAYGPLLARPDTRFTIFATGGCGFKNFAGMYEYPFRFVRVDFWQPVLKRGTGGRDWNFALETTPDELRKMILNAGLNYIYIENARPGFFRDFAALFVPGAQLDELRGRRPENDAEPSVRVALMFRVRPDGQLEALPPAGK